MIGELQHREFILNWVLSILRILVRKKKKLTKYLLLISLPFLSAYSRESKLQLISQMKAIVVQSAANRSESMHSTQYIEPVFEHTKSQHMCCTSCQA